MPSASDQAGGGGDPPEIVANALTLAYGAHIVQRELNFTIQRGQIFVVMGGSGCGKSTLLRHLVALQRPASGGVYYRDQSLWECEPRARSALLRRIGVLFQSGALWSSMTLAQNVALPLERLSTLSRGEIVELVSLKLALVGLAGYEQFYPAEISGGMRKRAGLARAMALDPEILFFDEPSAGLDPLTARRLDDLILELRDSLGATVVVVTHELASIFAIADDAIFLDAESKRLIAQGPPRELLKFGERRVRQFLTRGQSDD